MASAGPVAVGLRGCGGAARSRRRAGRDDLDAFQRIYAFRTRDLLRIATGGTGVLPEGSISRDLVDVSPPRPARSPNTCYICIRALDYSPPNDITFGSYLRALITADIDIAPEDENGYRVALIEAFRARGIFPNRVNTLSVDSLLWQPPRFTEKEEDALDFIVGELRDDIRGLVEASDRQELARISNRAQSKLHERLIGKQGVLGARDWERFLNKLGLTSRPVTELFGRSATAVRFMTPTRAPKAYIPPIEVHTVRPAFRAGREGRQIEQVVITLTQRVETDIGTDGDERRMVFRGGCSLILGLGNLNRVEHVIVKNIRSYDRYRDQVAYMNGTTGAPPAVSPYADDKRPERLAFSLLHRRRGAL